MFHFLLRHRILNPSSDLASSSMNLKYSPDLRVSVYQSYITAAGAGLLFSQPLSIVYCMAPRAC